MRFLRYTFVHIIGTQYETNSENNVKTYFFKKELRL